MAYIHGAYAYSNPSGLYATAKTSTLAVYFGVAPVHQLASYKGLVNTPVIVDNDRNAVAQLGYSDAWGNYSLCEAHYLHFRGSSPIGPVAFVNVLDPEKHRSANKSTEQVTFVNKTAYLKGAGIILATITIAGKELGVDFDAQYDTAGAGVVVTDLKGTMTGAITAEWFNVDMAAITEDVIAKAIKDCIGLVYEVSNKAPALMAAPGWSDKKVVNDALKVAAAAINGHWNGFVYSDIEVQNTTTIEAAIAKKAEDSRNAGEESPCWPMVTDGNRYYHLSTQTVYTAMLLDSAHDGVPYETPSNKPITILGLVVGDGKGGYVPYKHDKLDANRLNEVGIKTVIFWGGQYVIWGPHTGAYDYNKETLAEEVFDCSVRMTQYLGNEFQLRYGTEVDKPMHRSRIGTILNSFQEWLDNLVARGALLHGKISFLPDSNQASDMMMGEFVFDTGYTTTPPGRAIINRFRYTNAGLETLTGGA